MRFWHIISTPTAVRLQSLHEDEASPHWKPGATKAARQTRTQRRHKVRGAAAHSAPPPGRAPGNGIRPSGPQSRTPLGVARGCSTVHRSAHSLQCLHICLSAQGRPCLPKPQRRFICKPCKPCKTQILAAFFIQSCSTEAACTRYLNCVHAKTLDSQQAVLPVSGVHSLVVDAASHRPPVDTQDFQHGSVYARCTAASELQAKLGL